MPLNIDKTNFALFLSFTKEETSKLINLKFGKSIEKTENVKFLGVVVDEHLSWKYHINELYTLLKFKLSSVSTIQSSLLFSAMVLLSYKRKSSDV